MLSWFKSLDQSISRAYLGHSPIHQSRIRIFLTALYITGPVFLAVVIPRAWEGSLSNALDAVAMVILITLCLRLLSQGRSEPAVLLFGGGAAAIFLGGHFTGDYTLLNDSNPLLIDRLAYLGAINLVLTALISESFVPVYWLTGVYLAAGVVQIFAFHIPAMAPSLRPILITGSLRFLLSFVFLFVLVAVLHRVTRQAVAQAEHSLSTLESQVSERTLELRTALAQLQSAQGSLIEGERMSALGRLSATVAHEINSPLGAISSTLSTLEDLLAPLPESLLEILSSLPRGLSAAFFAFVRQSSAPFSTMSSRDRVRRQSALRAELDRLGVPHPADAARHLTDLGHYSLDPSWTELLRHERCLELLDLALTLKSVTTSVEIGRRATQQAVEYVDALRRFSFPKDESAPLEPVNLAQSIETVLLLLKADLGPQVRVIRNYRGTAMIQGSPNRLFQVWMNLFQNALQAMKGRGELKISVLTSGTETLVEIQDSGPGIAPEHLKRIFDPFFTTKSADQGTGLGLQIVHDIVTAHRGHIDVSSVPGKTVFRILFGA